MCRYCGTDYYSAPEPVSEPDTAESRQLEEREHFKTLSIREVCDHVMNQLQHLTNIMQDLIDTIEYEKSD